MRTFDRYRAGKLKEKLPVWFRSPITLAAGPSIGTGGGVDLNAIERVLNGEWPVPELTCTEARIAWQLLHDPEGVFSAAEIGAMLGVSERTVTRWCTGVTGVQEIPASGEGNLMALEWQQLAACARMEPEAWFPRSYRNPPEMAVGVCWSQCPVRRECLAWAMKRERGMSMEERRHEGVCGGLTPYQRHEAQELIDAAAPAGEVIAA